MKIQKNNSIILIGMPGCGKTTIGKYLAQKTGLEFIDLDSVIEENENSKITEIFKNKGEKYFRELEHKTLLSFIGLNAIISTGGGVAQNPDNLKILKESGVVFYLQITPDSIYKRIKSDKTRPLLLKDDPLFELKKLYNERKANYEKADFIINADDTVQNIADKVIEIYEETIGSNKK